MVLFVFFKRTASDKCISHVSIESFNISTLHSIIIYIRQAHNTGFIHIHNDTVTVPKELMATRHFECLFLTRCIPEELKYCYGDK